MLQEWRDFWGMMRRLDDREVSDEARGWARHETEIVDQPADKGAWLASMEIAFEAGRRWERKQRGQRW